MWLNGCRRCHSCRAGMRGHPTPGDDATARGRARLRFDLAVSQPWCDRSRLERQSRGAADSQWRPPGTVAGGMGGTGISSAPAAFSPVRLAATGCRRIELDTVSLTGRRLTVRRSNSGGRTTGRLRHDIGLVFGRIRLRRRQASRQVAQPGKLTGGNRLQAQDIHRNTCAVAPARPDGSIRRADLGFLPAGRRFVSQFGRCADPSTRLRASRDTNRALR